MNRQFSREANDIAMVSHQENETQKSTMIPSHSNQSDEHLENIIVNAGNGGRIKREPLCTADGNVN